MKISENISGKTNKRFVETRIRIEKQAKTSEIIGKKNEKNDKKEQKNRKWGEMDGVAGILEKNNNINKQAHFRKSNHLETRIRINTS